MTGISALSVQASSATVVLAAQIAQLQADIQVAGNLDNASVDQITGVILDATQAIATATSLEAAHEAILEIASPADQLAGSLDIDTLLFNFAALSTASAAEPLAFDTLNRLRRLQTNLTAIGT